jgi:hypothetical protein
MSVDTQVGTRGDHDYGQPAMARREQLGKIKSAHAWHVDISEGIVNIL